MRKVLVAVLVLLAAAGLIASASGDPNVRRDETAFSDWFVPTGEKGRFAWFGAYVFRDTVIGGTGDWFSFAGFVKGRCTREKTPEYVSIECTSTDIIQADPNKHFEMSPLATDARLRVRDKGRTHSVTWTVPPGGHGLYSSSEYCWSFEPGEEEPEEEGQGYGGGIANAAQASGRLFGQRFSDPAKSRFAILATGVMVTTCSFRSVDYDATDDILRVTLRTPR